MTILFGADRVVRRPELLGPVRRAGLITNDAARLATDASVRTRAALRDAGMPIVRLFGPEHGMSATAPDGAAVADGTDRLTGLPVISLYGDHLEPPPGSLRDLDAVVFDIPDTGARFYTYVWTLFHALRACEAAGIPLVVLDRPNPLGGQLGDAEGPMLDPRIESFVGSHPIPVRHSLTSGELALLWRRERFPNADVLVIPCDGWTRAMLWSDTGLPFVPMSPAMTSIETALLYPGMCLFEATNFSVGRGTDAPFQRIGAPWLDTERVLELLAPMTPRGVRFETEQFTPAIAVYAAEPCAGIRITITDARALRPVALGLLLLAAAVTGHRLRFSWWRYPTAANPSGEGHFERLVGRMDIRARYDTDPAGINGAVVAGWTDAAGWRERTEPVLLYR